MYFTKVPACEGPMQIIQHRSLVTRPQGKDELLSFKCTKHSGTLEGH